MNYASGQTRSNNAVVSLNASGEIDVFVGQASGSVHFILDVNGYFGIPCPTTLTTLDQTNAGLKGAHLGPRALTRGETANRPGSGLQSFSPINGSSMATSCLSR